MKGNIATFMSCPACNLDLNPIENLWGILARRFFADARQFDTANELKTTNLLERGKSYSPLGYNQVTSIRNRFVEVLERGGQKTDQLKCVGNI